jgi:uncharacterized protein YrrD
MSVRERDHFEKRNSMLIKSKELTGYKLGATDGDIGKVEEFYFDDKHWTIRYLVADTGGWLSGREVLISPYALESIDRFNHSVLLNINKSKIEKSPFLQSDEPVSQQFENSFYGYYGWPTYYSGFYPWGASNYLLDEGTHLQEIEEKNWDPHLRSTRAVSRFDIHARDGDIGHVSDFIIDDETWAIRYLVVQTGNWLSGKEVLISPKWIQRVSWSQSKVFTSLSREEVRSSPHYSEQALLDRAYETDLFEHYGLIDYWSSESSHRHATRSIKKEPINGRNSPI